MQFSELPKKYQDKIKRDHVRRDMLCMDCPQRCRKAKDQCKQNVIDMLNEGWHDFAILRDPYMGIIWREMSEIDDDDPRIIIK